MLYNVHFLNADGEALSRTGLTLSQVNWVVSAVLLNGGVITSIINL